MSLDPVSKKRIAIAVAVVGSIASLLAITTLVGHPARLVDLLGIFGSALGAGAALVVAVRRNP